MTKSILLSVSLVMSSFVTGCLETEPPEEEKSERACDQDPEEASPGELLICGIFAREAVESDLEEPELEQPTAVVE